MKLLIVTTVAEYQEDVLKMLKESGVEAFSTSEIDGYKNLKEAVTSPSWFPAIKAGYDSLLYFSFTDEEKLDRFMKMAKSYNDKLKTNNPVRAVSLNIEKFI
ncbi:MAG: hypothetical protein EA362_10090 [Saprospirales bacterium]|nr:MAG: hypothetical protein EA362_10090 [Saprospirales bacterium]